MPTAPFVLLDDARDGGAGARLYVDPVEIVAADRPEAVVPALERLRSASARGLHAAGYLTYEAGAALMPRALPTRAVDGPLLWFGLFADYRRMDAAAVAAWLPDPAGAWAAAPSPRIERHAYDDALGRVLEMIRAGDIYQANLTLRADVRIAGDPAALYARLRQGSAAGHGALVATGERHLLSLSPELFFTLDDGALACRPMKGTATRGDTADEDRARIATLEGDPKQRAENLMIVDLMRNDLSRIAVPGSVAVPALFTVETYPTVHQMTSTVTATLADGRDAVDVLTALFPCGSITGAPKQRSMEVIAAVEDTGRGAYTGAIGRIDRDGDAAFNVAIRTLVVTDGTAELGLGSGIVADSRGDEEWAECLAKGAFVTAGQRPLDLIETMAFDPEQGLALLDPHLERMRASARALGFRFDRHGARNELQAATFRLRAPARVRLLLAQSGAIAIEVAPAPVPFERPLRVAVVPLPVDPGDFRLRHKTSDRGFYDAARIAAGTDEVVFVRPDGALTEGSFTTVFVARNDGMLLTPPLAAGLLPGVLRSQMIDSARAIETNLSPDDLSGQFFVGNALRGLMPATRAVAKTDPLSL
ncbi:para-aminobenzoate synthetase/4-amino-4-deoxychorismate lyase [Sphingomonas insulae]|uniref:Probable branched-chain-amino-acid aminotransferase n=1 Tax=Sphingomonas insulae TaxID=424800 RepID=A0ABN1HKC4_9SPHN|nr:aminodeoxychorismate synthase component I [Sphingomonas insulae]NIJ30444.1 para-aminobenzoate synthetase/4-amino-4-deoxychorismate lyase [Sphingomonas insulae]